MFEWKLDAVLAKSPELINVLGNSSHPFVRKHHRFIEVDGEN